MSAAGRDVSLVHREPSHDPRRPFPGAGAAQRVPAGGPEGRQRLLPAARGHVHAAQRQVRPAGYLGIVGCGGPSSPVVC